MIMLARHTKTLIFSVIATLFSLSAFAQTGREWFDKAQATEDPLLQAEYLTRAIDGGYKENWAYYYRGWAYYDSYKYGKALRDFTEATSAPGNIDQTYVSSGLAWTYYRLSDYPNAQKWAAKAREQKPTNSEAWNVSGWIEIDLKNYPKAAEYYTEQIKLKPSNSMGYSNRAYAYMMMRQYENVLADCDKALKIDPSDEWLLQRKALALLKLDRKPEALKLMGEKLKYKDDDPLSLSNIGVLFFDGGDYSGAIEFHTQGILLYEKKIKQDPKYIQMYQEDIYNIYLNRGQAFYWNKEYQKALQDYSKASLVKPADYRAWYEIGELQTQQENWLEATHGYEKAFAIKPDLPDGWVNLGFCYSNLLNDAKAVDAYTRGIKANPNVGLLYNNRGYTYLEQKLYDKAFTDLNKAIEVDPTEVMSHVSLGEFFYMARKDYPAAIAKFDEALKMENGGDRAYHTAYYTRGKCYYEQGQFEKAEADFREAVDLDHKSAKSWEGLGLAHYAQKEMCDAYIAFKKAVDLEAGKTVREAMEAPKYLAKLTANPCK